MEPPNLVDSPIHYFDYRITFAIVGMFISFLFSASETALTSLGRLEIQRIMSQGGFVSRLMTVWQTQPSKILIIILVGNNIANIVATSCMALWANFYFQDFWVSLAMGLFTFLFILFAEILPKILARQKAMTLSPMAMRFVQFSGIILKPVTIFVGFIARRIARVFGIKAGGELQKPMSEEELSHTIAMATREGGLDKETGEALSNLMEFPDRLARDIMVPRSKIAAFSIGDTQNKVLNTVSEEGFSRYPVYRKDLDEIVGTLHVKDLLESFNSGKRIYWTRMIRRPFFVSEMAYLGDILRDMKRWGTHLALVRNETGVITGLVTLEDLIEEIVGEIRDEHDDPSEAGTEAAIGGPKIVDGEISIVDFNELYRSNLPLEANYSTLNGYMLYRLGGQLPVVGTLIVDDDYTFRINSVSEQGIAKLEVIEQDRDREE